MSRTKTIPYVIFITAQIIRLIVAFWGDFGDEQENFTASWLMSRGMVPYRDFFFHHAPLPYFIGIPGYWISSQPWVWFRLVIAIWWLLCGLATLKMTKKSFHLPVSISWFIVAFSAPFFQHNQFLAESIITPVFISLILLLINDFIYGFQLSKKRLLYWFIIGFVSIWSTIVAIPSIGWFFVAMLLAYQRDWKTTFRQFVLEKKHIWLIGLILHGGLILYFLINQSLQQMIWSVFTYNIKYYFPLRLANTLQHAQRGYLISTIQNFFSNSFQEIQTIFYGTSKAFITFMGLFKAIIVGEFITPAHFGIIWTEWVHTTVGLGTITVFISVAVLVILLIKRQFVWVIWLVIFLNTLRGRDNEIFKLGPYYLTVVAGWIAIVVVYLQKHKYLFGLFGSLIIMGWVTIVFPSYQKFIITKPEIISPVLMQHAKVLAATLPQTSESIYVLGGNPAYYLLTHKENAHPFFYYHPWFHGTPPMREAVIQFLKTNQEYPVVLESELDGSTLVYASELENFVKETYIPVTNGVYLPSPKRNTD